MDKKFHGEVLGYLRLTSNVKKYVSREAYDKLDKVSQEAFGKRLSDLYDPDDIEKITGMEVSFSRDFLLTLDNPRGNLVQTTVYLKDPEQNIIYVLFDYIEFEPDYYDY